MSSQNHNRLLARSVVVKVVPYSVSTSNHNYSAKCGNHTPVVPYSVSTSNHNCVVMFLKGANCCSLFCFYIKPQLVHFSVPLLAVVPYSVSTSNHNVWAQPACISLLFLILFLHQTTTAEIHDFFGLVLFLSLFLHQTTTAQLFSYKSIRCSLVCFYIKPQLASILGHCL